MRLPARALATVAALAVGWSGGRAQNGDPLPDRDTFYRQVRENLARAERANHLYTYRERRTDVHTNPFGRLGTGGVSLYEVYPSPVRELVYRRVVERNGAPVPAREIARQDREYRAHAAEVLLERGAGGSDEERFIEDESARARQRRQRAIDDVVDALEFDVEGRTLYKGVPAIVIAFRPRTGAKPTTRPGRVAQKFAGTVWVDERAAEVMQIEATSIEDISYGLGIVARLGEGTTATVTRKPVGDGLWMPTKLTLSGRGRAVLFRRLVVDHAIEWFDYRRLPDDSLAPFLDARVHGEAGRGP
ncbi:MAG: hypothetical protein A3I61_18470 [Acidobacteria bacterium RIFCSPLOWO2_02_FULL_68_18]|nr:MAG: hypothetical protein A3I61_18470 [Acidobacteria bacterium RIFCSPLOWO2_02_FULL_68_18]OFW48036.1 MAG: hypothetical protein A3G77_11085 [Acidobacteria bacterium RIFCSPLOWO2_12_FULL_68_19]